ncbi:Conserved hypothetical, protein [Geosmithia morbida]|uniref:Conserved hypothetical, protein n=1 Tax=Geosmithia morbida TaxID=1094350 RepID=A0A9P5D3L4_9HYPO|nr:Conserved hypothetical, protein [Geosmithia morbida]KAF4121910.1 Conserved hypothetical, protein [Geosmithia morbida]
MGPHGRGRPYVDYDYDYRLPDTYHHHGHHLSHRHHVDDDDDDHHHHHHHRPRHHTRAVKDTRPDEKINHAAKTALQSAAIEAVRVHGRPGKWNGEKGARVATAALGAAFTDAVTERPDDKHRIRHKVGDLAGAWIVNRAINGPVDDMGKKEGSRRRRSSY